ncbi:MAG: arginine--tRNA ligase, partial [Dehalococcoidia bacterium]
MIVRDRIVEKLKAAVQAAQQQGILPLGETIEVAVEHPQNPQHGDFATSLPLRLARASLVDPMTLAERLASLIPAAEELERVWAAAPGFVNFTLSEDWLRQQVEAVREVGGGYARLEVGRGQQVQVEFVSVNPTGPVHVGHARGAVFGSTLANILAAAGYGVTREYYLNDTGSQIELFCRSLYARYRQALGHDAELPSNGYLGEYLVELGQELATEYGDRYLALPEGQGVAELGAIGFQRMVQRIREDLGRIRVEFDLWFSEGSLFREGQYDKAVEILRQGGYLADREGALWFVSTALGEDKDNVLVRSTGAPTYFAS